VSVNAARRSATEKRTQRQWEGGIGFIYGGGASGRAVITFRRLGATRPCQSQLTCGPGHDAYPTGDLMTGTGGWLASGVSLIKKVFYVYFRFLRADPENLSAGG
jgi:hypothetical protein